MGITNKDILKTVAIDVPNMKEQLDSNIQEVNNLKGSKVDKITGKGLSTNDYDNIEKSEVAKIKEKADSNEVRKNNVQINMSDLSQEVKQAMTGGSVAIVGKNMLNRQNVIEGELVEEKFSATKKGNNLVNPSRSISGFYIGIDGVLVADANYSVTDFIPVESSGIYRKNSGRCICYYDINYNFIRGEYKADVITMPTNCKYVRMTAEQDGNIMFYKGDIAKNNEDYYFELDKLRVRLEQLSTKISNNNILQGSLNGSALDINSVNETQIGFIEVGKNKFNKDTITPNCYINGANGDVIADTTNKFSLSDYIYVKPNTLYTKTSIRTFALFDKNYNLIKIASPTGSSFTTPTNAQYVRITVENANLDKELLYEGNDISIFEPYEISIKNFNGGVDNMKNLFSDSNYTQICKTSKFEVYKPNNVNGTIVAIYQNIAVKLLNSKTLIQISIDGINGDYTKNQFMLTKANLPSLLDGSYIQNVIILPWSRNKETKYQSYGQEFRICLITNLGQIFHNYPSRSTTDDGVEQVGDISRFEESVIWDLPERKYPSKSKTPDKSEYYNPTLPDTNYVYVPPINQTSTYGNNGFPKYLEKNGKVFPRFYVPVRSSLTSPVNFLGGFDCNDKLGMIATYNVESTEGQGSRFCILITDDGGRQWYCKYEFYHQAGKLNWGNNINTSSIVGNYTSETFEVRKKIPTIPSATIKEPTTKFTFGSKSLVTSITKAGCGVVTTKVAHGFENDDVVVFSKINGYNNQSSDFEFILNDTITESNIGAGVMFRVKVLSSTTFELKEHVHSLSNQLPCTHIHAVNKIKDGFLIGTGEGYPNSWLLNFRVPQIDMYGYISASSDFVIDRLTSTDKSIERTLGAIMLDDVDNTIIYASDNGNSYRGSTVITDGRTDTLTRNSAGLMKGRLIDVDDASKFYPMLEFAEPIYCFRDYNGIYVIFGQRGEFAISFDKGQTWDKKKFLLQDISKNWGYNNEFINVNGVIVALRF